MTIAHLACTGRTGVVCIGRTDGIGFCVGGRSLSAGL